MRLLAPTVLRIPPPDLAARVRERFAGQLRRSGSFAQLCLLGAEACLAAAGGRGSIAILCCSRLGALAAVRAALSEELRRGEPVMPFTFIGMQPHLAGALLVQRGYPVTRSLHLHPSADSWPLVLNIARSWLAAGDRVLAGWVEESGAPGVAHRSDWCVLQRAEAPAAVRCTPATEAAAGEAAAEDWIERVAAWRSGPVAPLLLRGENQSWRFALEQ
jgi:hypothetical protein